MPRGVPTIGLEDWFNLPAEKRKRLVAKWLDIVIGGGYGRRGDPRATYFVRKAVYAEARKYLGVKKLPPQIKRDINKLLEEVD